jgi:farnesyl-diphosphate farnesyltransferase
VAVSGLEELLEKTSRTFALSIPALPEPTRRQVMIAYLLFRIADTFEDAADWPAERRLEALRQFQALLADYSRPEAERLAAQWEAVGAFAHAGYGELVAQAPFVLDAFFALDSGAVEPVRAHLLRSAGGMAEFAERCRDGGRLALRDLADLRAYCYVVAGIVGEMLTELFLLEREMLAPAAPYLRERAATFGEALQLVNILKDAPVDLSEGRSFLPPGLSRGEVFTLARHDLASAAEYTLALQRAGAPRGIVEFTALPAELAWATLDRVERSGPGSKISRIEVQRIRQRLERALDRGEPPFSLSLRERAGVRG